MIRLSLLACVLLAFLVPVGLTAPEGTPAARHGGKVLVSGSHAIEVHFGDPGIHVFPLGLARHPGSTLGGKVTLRARTGDPLTLDLDPVRDQQGRVTLLMAMKDLSAVRDGSRKVTLRIDGLAEATTEFSTIFRRTPSKMAGSGSAHDMAGSHSAHEAARGHRH